MEPCAGNLSLERGGKEVVGWEGPAEGGPGARAGAWGAAARPGETLHEGCSVGPQLGSANANLPLGKAHGHFGQHHRNVDENVLTGVGRALK